MAERADVTPLRRAPRPLPVHRQLPGPVPRRQPPESEPRQQRESVPRRRTPELEPRQPLPPQEPLWREVLGQRLRAIRQDQRETLSETAGRAGISPQYLSEVERGRKEPSSEMIAALAGALGITLTELTEQLAGDLRRRQRTATELRRQQGTSRGAGPVVLALAA